MKLPQTITFTGADDRNHIPQLIALCLGHPEIELGILVSASNIGGPRYPTRPWQQVFAQEVRQPFHIALRVSVHAQGRWLRDLLKGGNLLAENASELLSVASRIQLNFHRGPIDCDLDKFLAALRSPPLSGKQIIFQCDGATGEEFFMECWGESNDLDLVPFFDASGGAGHVPETWPRAEYVSYPGLEEYKQTLALHGYAGGLGPYNITAQLPLIAAAAGDAPYWIDMETHVCDPQHGLLLDRCEAVVKAVSAFGSEVQP